jgi:hypothetical protein
VPVLRALPKCEPEKLAFDRVPENEEEPREVLLPK